jgi:hypothetical protein
MRVAGLKAGAARVLILLGLIKPAVAVFLAPLAVARLEQIVQELLRRAGRELMVAVVAVVVMCFKLELPTNLQADLMALRSAQSTLLATGCWTVRLQILPLVLSQGHILLGHLVVLQLRVTTALLR